MALNTKEKAEQVLNMIIALNEELAELAHQHEEEANQEELLLTLANSLDKYLIIRARKIVTKFHNYSYEIVMSPVIVNSYKNGHNSYQIVK